MQNRNNGLLRWIAVFKFLKALTLIVLGITVLRMAHGDPEGTLVHWIARLGLAPGHRFLDGALAKVANLPPRRFRELGLASFLYAALFLTEGTGLWLLKPWAEWFTTIITASLLPLEIFELLRHPTVAKVLVLLLNIAIVIYLILRIRKERTAKQ